MTTLTSTFCPASSILLMTSRTWYGGKPMVAISLTTASTVSSLVAGLTWKEPGGPGPAMGGRG